MSMVGMIHISYHCTAVFEQCTTEHFPCELIFLIIQANTDMKKSYLTFA